MKLILILAILMATLGGCAVVPYNDGYYRSDTYYRDGYYRGDSRRDDRYWNNQNYQNGPFQEHGR